MEKQTGYITNWGTLDLVSCAPHLMSLCVCMCVHVHVHACVYVGGVREQIRKERRKRERGGDKPI